MSIYKVLVGLVAKVNSRNTCILSVVNNCQQSNWICKRDITFTSVVENSWGGNKLHRKIKLNFNMTTPENEVILAPLRLSVKEQVIASFILFFTSSQMKI